MIPVQATSNEIWAKKYKLRDKNGNEIDKSMNDTYKRVAHALAAGESDSQHWEKAFLWALENGAIPAGRIISNAGALEHKPATSTINCTVSGTIHDSMDDILAKVHEAGLTLKSGSGIGYEFSTLRPRGAYVSGAGAYTSGPLSFMDIFDKMCFTVSSAGGRRGAQMATFDVGHPDVIDVIRAKREDGRLRQFNISLLITKEFMEAVEQDKDWNLAFDGKTYKTIRARDLWDLIMRSNYDYAEPGFILIDKYNEMNNNWWCENIRATNPCGEQGLPPYGSCLLGSINLTQFVKDPFTDHAEFDFYKFRDVVSVFTRMLDNVVEINGLALGKQRDEIIRKRRHGMGYLGLGSALAMMGIKYGSPKSVEFTKQLTKELAITGFKQGLSLAKEKGAAPIMDEEFTVTAEMMSLRPEMAKDGIKVGDTVPGRILFARYSRYMQKLGEIEPELINELALFGSRFSHHSSIAPTGTISLSLANNASNGIEPSFSHYYSRNVITEGKKTKEKVEVYSYELLAYRALVDKNATPDNLPDYFVQADTVKPSEHIAIQAAAQEWIDSSISKTINVPSDIPYHEFTDIYLNAYRSGLKGCSTFRYNPENFQGVLVKDKDLEATTYRFTLENGEVVTAKGNEEIEYDGEKHSAANLYDALKEGYYGKF